MFRLFRLDPPNGWRHVWWELAIVTAGVLLALVAQQLAEAANWRARATDGKARLTDELKTHYAQLHEQASVSKCLEMQLDGLAATVVKGGRPPVYDDEFYGPIVFRAPHRDYDDSVWQGLAAEGVTSHIDRNYAASMSVYYAQLKSLRSDVVSMEVIERQFGILSRDITLSPDVRLDLVREIDGLKTVVRSMTINANQLITQLVDFGIRLSDGERRTLLPNSRTQDFCRARRLPLITPNVDISLS